MSMIDLRDKVAIVGVGDVDYASLYKHPIEGCTADYLAAQAFRAALTDAGLEKQEVDGLICSRVSSYVQLATLLGIPKPRVINQYEASGRMSALAVQTAAMAIATGLAETVACVYGNVGRSAKTKYGGFASGSSSIEDPNSGGGEYTANLDQLYGMTSPGAYTALMYQRYMADYGAPPGSLAPLALSNHRHAALNPRAIRRQPITQSDYDSARFIAEPLRLYDYCLINDGAVAIILTSTERAKDLRKRPVLLSGTATMADMGPFQSLSLDLWAEAGHDVSRRLYEASGVDRSDVQCLQIYDCFTPHIIFALESFGFCAAGEGWEWIQGGRCEIGGELPINTSGGHTAESYMQGWNLQVEAVRQLRGECGERQVADCEVAQYITEGPIVTSHILRGA